MNVATPDCTVVCVVTTVNCGATSMGKRGEIIGSSSWAGELSAGWRYTTPSAIPEERRVEKSELLKQLHIDRSATEAPRSRTRWLVPVGYMFLVFAGGLFWFALTLSEPPTVRTAVVRATSQQPVTDSVLDASGEVRAVVEFIARHSNLTGAVAFHTYSGVLLRPYTYSGSRMDHIQNPTGLKKPLASVGERVCRA
jgi:hypothetical protein